MPSFPLAAAALLTASSLVSALPEITISKRDRHSNGATQNVARGLLTSRGLTKRQSSGGSGGSTVITNVYDVDTWSLGGAYYGNVTAGTPAQFQVVIIDTGSSDLYFDASTSTTCQEASSNPDSCRGGSFDSANSTTYSIADPSPAFNTSFGDGSSAVGPFGRDVVCIGDVCLDNVQFGVAEEVVSTTGYAVGLMGVGYSENEATSTVYPNMPEVLKNAGVINSRLYSVYLNDESSTGSILFGGIDTSRYTGDLATLNLLYDVGTNAIDQFITTVTALNATVSGKTTSFFSGGSPGAAAYDRNDASQVVLLDTGSSAWSVTSSLYKSIAKAFPYIDSSGFCPCSYQNTGDSVSLQFGGAVTINVPSREFIVPVYNATTNEPLLYDTKGDYACAFMISEGASTGQGFLTLGDAILRSMYLVYDLDNGQVSIAQAKLNQTGSGSIVVVPSGVNGVASAVSSNYVSASGVQSYSIAPEVSATVAFSASTAQSTIGEATGTDAIPADSRPSADSTSAGTGAAAASSSKGVAAGVTIPGFRWEGVWVTGIAVLGAAVGMGLMM